MNAIENSHSSEAYRINSVLPKSYMLPPNLILLFINVLPKNIPRSMHMTPQFMDTARWSESFTLTRNNSSMARKLTCNIQYFKKQTNISVIRSPSFLILINCCASNDSLWLKCLLVRNFTLTSSGKKAQLIFIAAWSSWPYCPGFTSASLNQEYNITGISGRRCLSLALYPWKTANWIRQFCRSG